MVVAQLARLDATAEPGLHDGKVTSRVPPLAPALQFRAMRRMLVLVATMMLAAGCASSGGSDSGTTSTAAKPAATTPTVVAKATTTEPATTTAPTQQVTAGAVTVLANAYGLPDTTGWDTAAVFDLTNNGTDVIAVPYRVKVESDDGQTTATSDGSDVVVLSPGETVTIVLDTLDPTGPNPPTKGTVTVYGRTTQEAVVIVGAPGWTSSNESFECDNGLVGCGVTGDLTYNGAGLGSPSGIQVVVYDGDKIVAAGHPTTEVPDVPSGRTIPYAGQITVAEGFTGTGFSKVSVSVADVFPGN
ncbi:MAG: hypothetical protein U0P45_08125 [Acidimicrobiales bacterium]